MAHLILAFAALMAPESRVDALPLAPPVVEPEEFRDWYDAASRKRLSIPKEVERRASRFRYVFVGGFLNERLRGYFAQNARELRARGVPRAAIHEIHPSSNRTFEENIGAIRDEFDRLAALGPEKLVVIAHSRGACDTLSFALQDPEFIQDHVAALFLVQGPFGGTGLADYVLGEGTSMDRRMPPGHRLIAHLLGWFEKRLLRRGHHGGLAGLTRDASRAFWECTLAEHADAIPVVGPKTYFVLAQARHARLRLFLRSTARYLDTYYGPNDGIVALSDQALPGLGTRLGPLDAGHPDLISRFPWSRAGRRARKAFIQSIIMAVGREINARGPGAPGGTPVAARRPSG